MSEENENFSSKQRDLEVSVLMPKDGQDLRKTLVSHRQQQSSDLSSYKEDFPNVTAVLKKKVWKTFRLQTVLDTFPILKWLPKYERGFLIEDFVAGITVGLTTIPQTIAIAVVAGLEPQYGLYSSFMSCFVYMLFGSCKDMSIGPTAIMAVMIHDYVAISTDFAILISFLSGCIITLFGILNLGVLIQFLSVPVIAAFASASAIIIGSGQICPLLGIKSKSNDVIEIWKNVFSNITEVRLTDSILGITSLILLLLLRKLKDVPPKWKIIGKYLSLARNALIVCIGILIAFIAKKYDYEPFILTGNVTAGIPEFKLPPFSTVSNDGIEYGTSDMLKELGSTIIAVPFLAILGHISIAKAFSKGNALDSSQEMIALGVCNIASSFFSAMPITGSITRTAVNNSSGVRTTFGGFFSGILVLLALGFLSKVFYFIPKASLASIIIASMIFMVEYETAIKIWNSKRMDIIPFIVTLVACLFWSLEYGILCGVCWCILSILLKTARPNIHYSLVNMEEKIVLVINLDNNLVFSSADFLRQKILKSVQKYPQSQFLVIDGSDTSSIDFSVASVLLSTIKDLKGSVGEILFWNWNKSASSVLYRINKDIVKNFIIGASLEEAFNNFLHDDDKKIVVQNHE